MALQNQYSDLALDATLKDGSAKNQILNTITETTGTITANGQTVAAPVSQSGVVTVFVYGTYSGVNLSMEVSPDNTNWFPVSTVNASTLSHLSAGVTGVISANNSISYISSTQGSRYFRARATGYTSGTANIKISTLAANGVSGVSTVTSGTVTVDTELPAAAAMADGAANATTSSVRADGSLFNGTTWDRYRNNAVVTVDSSSARTATGTGTTAVNYNARGMIAHINVTAVSGTSPTLVMKLQFSSDGTNWTDMPGAATVSINANGYYYLAVYPGMSIVANQSISWPVPRNWRFAWTIGGTTPSFTFTTIAEYIL